MPRVNIRRVTPTIRTALARTLIATAMLAAGVRTLQAQQSLSLFNGTDLTGWRVEQTTADVRDGSIQVGSGNGWVRTERAYADFVMTMDVRLEENAEAGLFVRAWPTFDQASRPNNGHRVRFQDLKPKADGWVHVEVDCAGPNLTVRVDGAVIHSSDTLENPQGHIALWASEKTGQFRAIEIQQRPVRVPVAPPGVVSLGAREPVGIVSPRPLFSPQPRYTPDAMRARISGNVTMTAVVSPDGTVRDVVLLRSLDPKHGLDQAAIETAQAWRFAPGTRAGEPVAVRIVIELDFNLR